MSASGMGPGSEPASGSRTVAVTGGAGFIGSAVCRRAAARGDRVVAMVRESEVPLLDGGVENVVVDWSDAGGAVEALRALSPSSVIHCAGASARAGESPAALYDANVCLVARVLEAVGGGCPDASVVVLSSAAVYGADAPVPTSESDPLDPRDDYGTSKAMAEMLVRAFASGHGLRACIARPFNVLGPGEPGGSVVSAIAGQLLAGPTGAAVPVTLREIVSVRDFVDIDDTADALLTIGERGEAGEVYNVCSGTGTTIAGLVEAAARAWGRTARLTASDPSLAGTISTGSCGRLRALGWKPQYTLSDSLQRIAATDDQG
jgi:GDP-4-dehydro-6-deoxy-D-mannose reductase